MRIYFTLCLVLINSASTFSQCELIENIQSKKSLNECCQSYEHLKEANPSSDSLVILSLCRNLLCDELDYETRTDLIDSLMHVESRLFRKKGRFIYESPLWNNYFELKELKKYFYELAYSDALKNVDHFTAHKFAKAISRNNSGPQARKKKLIWKEKALQHYHDYSEDDYFKLIEYHKGLLLRDTAHYNASSYNFEGYDYLIKKISSQTTYKHFKSLLESAISSSKVVKGYNRGRLTYALNFTLGHIDFEYYDSDISKYYYPDTVITDTVIVYNCYGKNASHEETITIIHDTIQNKIPNLNNAFLYRSSLRATNLFAILDKLEPEILDSKN